MKRILNALATALLALPAIAAVPLSWTVETSRAMPKTFDCYRGETLNLSAALTSYGEPLELQPSTYNLYWQTNGMADLYWSAPATVASNVISAVWSPTNDVGATMYNCFVGEPGSNYRAAFRLRMLAAPGAAPSDLPIPRRDLDFATIVVANAPYYTKDEADSAIASALEDYLPRAGGTAGVIYIREPYEVESYISAFYTSPESQTAFWMTVPGYLSIVYQGMENGLFTVKRSDGTEASISGVQSHQIFEFDDRIWKIESNDTNKWKLSLIGYVTSPVITAHDLSDLSDIRAGATLGATALQSETDPTVPAWAKAATKPTYTAAEVGAVASESDPVWSAEKSDYATQTELTSAANTAANALAAAAEAQAVAQRIFTFVMGTGTVITVTNYDWQVTGKIPHFSIEDRTDPTNTVIIYDSTLEHADTLAKAKAYSDAHSTDPAWSLYASGTGQAAPADTTWISTPQTVLAGGLEFSKTVTSSGDVWFLTYTGLVGTQCATTNGYLQIASIDGTPALTFKKGDSYTVGCNAGSIISDDNTFVVTYTVEGLSSHPTLLASLSLEPASRNFVNASTLGIVNTWTSDGDTYTVTITKPEGIGSCFFMAQGQHEGVNVVEFAAPVSGGIMCTDGIHKCHPVWHEGGSITWEAF